jgi:acylphosphatase
VTAEVRVRVVVSGRVQGVFFRVETRDMARRLGLAGFVRNRADGAVEAVFQGPKASVNEAIAWCRRGPPMAAIKDVEVSTEELEEIDGFRIAN